MHLNLILDFQKQKQKVQIKFKTIEWKLGDFN